MNSKDRPQLIPLSIITDAPEAQRLAEAFNRLGGQIMTAVDGAIHTRTAPPAARRARHLVHGALIDAGMQAMIALGHTITPDQNGENDHG
ncbi:hypothetical protein [Pseudogemmobacter sonorensis]|uniref:hypothetical protein n=1 Tax=Pseudogemmobacter sonorensis TaxID=2989681 RepID=UPI00369503A3